MARPILFLSDLGVRDEFVGVCHSVIASIAPDAAVIDLSHGVPPTNVQAGAMTFRDCIAFAPDDGILMGVVDPGVGTDRKAIAVETASGGSWSGPTTDCSRWRGTRREGRPVRSRSPHPTCSSNRCRACSTGATCSRRPRRTWRPVARSRISGPS